MDVADEPLAVNCPRSLQGVRQARAAVRDWLDRHGADAGCRQALELAVTELGVNLVKHAPGRFAEFRVTGCRQGETLSLDLAAPTASFADESAFRARLAGPPAGDGLDESGRGLLMVATLAPDIRYQPQAAASDHCEHYRLQCRLRRKASA